MNRTAQMSGHANELAPAIVPIPDAKPLAGTVGIALLASLCCGGSLVFGLVGLAGVYRTLKLWQYVSIILPLATLAIVGINWLYYRHRAKMGCGPRECQNLRSAMYVGTFLSLAVMVGGFVFLTWLNHAVVNAERFMKIAKYAEALLPGVPNPELFYAVASLIGGTILIALLPFPSSQAKEIRP